jgi:hypothetical protein
MCATSSLALILPAFGVVSFPRQLTDHSAIQATGQTEPFSNGLILPGQGSVAVSTPFPNSDMFPPSLESNAPAPKSSVNKMGMGLWLLLVSTWFLSLFVWTIAPVPGGASKR